jgi:hypothetical protein
MNYPVLQQSPLGPSMEWEGILYAKVSEEMPNHFRSSPEPNPTISDCGSTADNTAGTCEFLPRKASDDEYAFAPNSVIVLQKSPSDKMLLQ